jgi:hypothetical protein
MTHKRKTVVVLYGKLLSLYPRAFRERLGESMEQTFTDLYGQRRRQKGGGLSGFVLWTFVETGMGIVQEHVLLIKEMNPVKNVFTNLGMTVALSVLLVLPFMVMEGVNRRQFNEDFPWSLFGALWLQLAVILLILLPILRNVRAGRNTMAPPEPTRGTTILARPASAAIVGAILLALPYLATLSLRLLHLEPAVDAWLNGPDPSQANIRGPLFVIGLFLLVMAAGLIAGAPIVRTLRAGGSLFAHPVNLVIVVLVLLPIIWGLTGLIIDQWPCFLGVPNCD